MDDLYRDYILEHYRHPHNFGIIEAPDARYEGANPLCGDRITMMLGIRDGTVAEVAKITPADVLDLLGIEISPARLKCALLSLDTVSHALEERGGAAAGD